MIFQNSIVRFIAFFIPDKHMRDSFVRSLSRKTQYRKLREDNKRLFAENAQIRSELSALRRHIDQKFLFFTNVFYGLEDIKYNNPDLRLLQEVDLMLLEQLKELCEKNGIEYWLHAGTLLGAVRHGGFIPWDDDVDIAMTRENFQKLESALSNDKEMVLNYHYIVNYCQKIGRVYFRDLCPKATNEDLVFLDIYIYDFLDIDDAKGFQHVFNKALAEMNEEMSALRSSENLEMDNRSYLKLDPKEAKKSNLDKLYTRFLANFEIKSKGGYLKNLTHYPDRPAIVRSSAVFPLKSISFEGKEYTVPNNTDEYLRGMYSNYFMLRTDAGFSHHRPLVSRYKYIEALRNFISAHGKQDD